MHVSPKIKVLQCIRQGKIGGGESHLLSLVENMDRSVFEPVVLSFTDGPMIDRLKNLKVTTKVIYTEKPFDFRTWKAVRNFVEESDVHLIHAHGTRAGSNILWAAKQLKLPLIYTIHGWSFHQDQNVLVKKIRVLGEKYITRKATVNISVSTSNQQTGMDNIPGFKSVVINNGIDTAKFNPDNQFTATRKALGVPENKTLFLFIARFTFQKQPLALIEAFKQALVTNPDIHLLMVGDGEQKAKARELLAGQNLAAHITLLDFRQDVPDILACADVFVLPSLWEGLPIGLLEAMAMRKTIIATDVDGTKEIIKDHENGILVDTQNMIPALTAAILQLAGNEALRKALANKARITVENSFNAQQMTKQIEDIYQQLVNRHSLVNKTAPWNLKELPI
jgi:glycosyltransferase involved in cell wall biosynthesis